MWEDQLDRVESVLAWWFELMVLGVVLFYAFLVYAFYRNGLHHFSIEQFGGRR